MHINLTDIVTILSRSLQVTKIHSVVIEILSFSVVFFLVTAKAAHLGMPSNKKSNWLHARATVKQRWYDSNEMFFVSHFVIFRHGSHLDYLILKQLKHTQGKNHFDTNLLKIHLTVRPIQKLSISCFVLILVMADGCHIGMPNCKKSYWLHARIISIQN